MSVEFTYDEAGNPLTAEGADGPITATYDRIGRVLSVDGDDGADTTHGYGFDEVERTDPSGSYAFDLDVFGREVAAETPLSATPFIFAYWANRAPAMRTAPNGNTTTFDYDDAGRLSSMVTTGPGGTPTRASFGYTYNRAGLRMSEASTITGDPSNGTASFGYDDLGRLITYDSPLGSGADQAYGWQAVPNRDGVTVGSGSPVTTTFDAADRITSQGYDHDLDGRMTERPGQLLEWDDLGRLTAIRDSSTNALISAYTYDALDRLRTVGRGGSIIRFRYIGLTTQVAQVVDDATDGDIRKLATSLTGQRLADWTPSETRHYGTNGHGDTTWTADGTGAVAASLRYDPWGNLVASSGSSLPDWRFQGSWLDVDADIQWVIARWYAPHIGRFISEDEVLGSAHAPRTRHLYAYAEGEPIGLMDVTGWASSRSASWRIRNDLGIGSLFELLLFIQQPEVRINLGIGQLILDGDGRGFGGQPRCHLSRACVIADFYENRVSVEVQPSCGMIPFGDYSCHDAYDINNIQGTQNVSVTETTNPYKLRVRWHLTQSATLPIPEIVPSIDGELVIRPPQPGYGGKIWVENDGFPSVELFSGRATYRAGKRTVRWDRIFTHGEGASDALYGGPDWREAIAWP